MGSGFSVGLIVNDSDKLDWMGLSTGKTGYYTNSLNINDYMLYPVAGISPAEQHIFNFYNHRTMKTMSRAGVSNSQISAMFS